MEESRWRKHVTWDDPEEIEAKYEELSSKIDNVLNPLSISDIQTSALREKGIEKIKASGENLRKELDLISSSQKQRTPSKSLQQKHEKLVSEMKDMQSQCGELSWTDIISNSEVRSFLEQYFPKAYKISTTDFLAFLEFEYPHYIDSSSIKEELISMLALDKKSGCISLNALELLTRDCGLEQYIQQIFERVDESIKESKAQINNEILQEVTEIKEMLDLKSIELDKREAKIISRENKLIKLENTLITEFREKIEKMAAQVKDKLSKEINAQMKRMQGLERNINDMIKLARSKQQILTRSELSMKNSGSESASGKFKARIVSLEKSNECMKTKLSLLELESKSDKITISKLSDDLQRIKARNSMLEQSLTTAKKAEPEKSIEMPPVVEKKVEPPKVVLSIMPEILLVFSIISTLITCCRMTLPIVHSPPSPRSISHKASIMEECDTTLGELFFPAFNVLIPGLIESVPFIYKMKKKDEQTVLIKFLWEVIIYAWSEEMPAKKDRKFYPNNLQFNPSTAFWKQKLSTEKAKASRKPIYQVFANLTVHKILGFYLLKWLNWQEKSQEIPLLAAFLVILTSTSKKRILSALNFIKDLIIEHFHETNLRGCIAVLVALLEYPDEICGVSCEILLSLSVDHFSAVSNQCCNENTAYCIIEACKKAVISGLKSGSISDLEEGLIVLLQKLSGQEYINEIIKQQGLGELLLQRIQTAQNNSFFQNNINSIIRNLSN